jgi:predicted transposase/invertase (TIGR01784 family)
VEPGTWIDRHHREHLSDLSLSVEIAADDDQSTTQDGKSPSARVYILVEHKSYRDPAALLQVLRYMVQVWSAEVRSDGTRPLTPIIPVLVYHGPEGGVVKSFSDLFPDRVPDVLRRYQVVFGADILDLNGTRRDDLVGDPTTGAALWMMRTVRRGTEDALRELQAILRGAADRLSEEDYRSLSRYLLETGELSMEQFSDKIEQVIHEGRIREGLMTTAEQLIQKGEQIGIQKGEAVGRMRERQELAKQMLAEGENLEKIARYTRLTVKELEALKDAES